MKYPGRESHIIIEMRRHEKKEKYHAKQKRALASQLPLEDFIGRILLAKDGKGEVIEWFVHEFESDKNNNHFMHILECTDDILKQKTLSLHIDKKSDQSLEEAIKNNFEWKK